MENFNYIFKDRKLNINEELYINRHKNGIKISQHSSVINHIWSIKNIFNQALSMYILDNDSTMIYANPFNLNLCGVENLKYLYGKTAYQAFGKKINQQVIKNDRLVLANKYPLFFDEQISNNEIVKDVISIKYPLYNTINEIIGIFGCSAIIDNSPAASLSLMMKIGLLNNVATIPGFQLKNIYFTQRETQVIKHIMMGKTAKGIAKTLSISPRTVETHIENIKNKFGVSTKADLIEKIYLSFC